MAISANETILRAKQMYIDAERRGHAAGDHAEFEIKFEDLGTFIKSDNEIWKDIKAR